jgi:hypothetical protein
MADNMDDGYSIYSDNTSESTVHNKVASGLRVLDDKKHKTKIWNMESGEWEKIAFYSTGTNPGTRIRHAITGRYYNAFVGTNYENLLFKVKWSIDKNPLTLFFNSPMEYERFFRLELTDVFKYQWLGKQQFFHQHLFGKSNTIDSNVITDDENRKVIIVK